MTHDLCLILAAIMFVAGFVCHWLATIVQNRQMIELAKMRIVTDAGESPSAFEQRDEKVEPPKPSPTGREGINRAIKNSLGEDFEMM
jgi:hypothetical protein